MNNIVPVRHDAQIDYSPKQLDLIRRTIAADCTPQEFDLYMEIARSTGLSPLKKQIYAVVFNKKNEDKRKMSIITGIDGYRAVAARNRDYRPSEDAPVIEYDPNIKGENNPAGIVSATVKCWKLAPNGEWHPVAGVAYWEEVCPLTDKWVYDKEQGKRVPSGETELDKKSNWYKMPRVMIAKVAEAQALRRGWPEDLSGIYTDDEMARSQAQELTASETVEQFEKDRRLQIIGAKESIFVQWNPSDPIEPCPVGQFADRAAAHVRACKELPDLIGWTETNRAAMNEFWARSKADALELKKIIEHRTAEIVSAGKA